MAGLMRALGGDWNAPNSTQEDEVADPSPMGVVR